MGETGSIGEASLAGPIGDPRPRWRTDHERSPSIMDPQVLASGHGITYEHPLPSVLADRRADKIEPGPSLLPSRTGVRP